MATSPINVREYFTHPALPPPVQVQQPTAVWGSQILDWIYTPARDSAAAAAQGLADRFSSLFAENQDEIINRVCDLFTQAILRRCPEEYHRLQGLIQSFLNNPSQNELDEIKELLDDLNEDKIRAVAPTINNTGIQQLTSLKDLLDNEIHIEPSIIMEPSPTLTITSTVRSSLKTAEAILGFIIDNHQGVLIQTLNLLSKSMHDQNGPISILREQLNHSQRGIIAESLALLKRSLNARAHPCLRQSKESLEAYRNALHSRADINELLPVIQTLHEKLELLMSEWDLFPQELENQWLQLKEFDEQLQEILDEPSSFSLQQQLEQSNVPMQLISTMFNAQRGIVEEASDILVEGIERGMMPLERLPKRMYQNFFPPQAATPIIQPGISDDTASIPNSSAEVRAPDFSNLNDVLTQGRRFLSSILSSTGDALSQQGASSLAMLVQLIFEKIREHIQQTSEQAHLLNTIDPMISRLQNARKNGSWGELIGVLQQAFQFMQEQQVYWQGLRLPLNPVRTYASAIPNFLQNFNAHQSALQSPSHRYPQTISDKDILQKAELFKNRACSFGPAKLVLEKICRTKTSDAVYAQIYEDSNFSARDAPLIFRRRLFQKIDQADLGFFDRMIKWCAKRIYDFILPLSSFYVNSIFDNILSCVKNGIKNSSSSQHVKEEFFIKIARNWLAVMSGAYNQVASAPASQAKDFGLMMEEALRLPERNGGLKQNELYAAVAKTAMDSFGPKIKWDKTIDQHFNIQIPKHSPLYFLNPLANGLNYFCTFCLKTILFIPQWVGNLILQSTAKITMGHSFLLQDYSNQTIESLRRNTPASYATQCLLYRQLQKILQTLQQNLSDDTSEAALLSRDTNIKTIEMNGLVEYLMEVLSKSQYRTQDRLNNYLQHHAPLRNRVERELEDTFIPEIMKDATKVLSVSLKTMTQENELQQMLYDALCIANDSFENKGPISDEDFAAIERGIKELSDQILEAAIFHAIDKKFDFTNEKQKLDIANFMDSLKEQSQIFTTQINQTVQEISSSPVDASTLVSKISSMIEFSSQYNRGRIDALGKADGNPNFHTETKYHLNELSRNISTYCTPMAQHLNRIKTDAEEINFYDHLLRPLFLSLQTSQILNQKLQDERLSSQDLTFCKTQLSVLQKHLATLQSYQCPSPITSEIQRYFQECISSLQKMEELQKAERISYGILPLFTRLKQKKLDAGNQPPSNVLKQLEKQLCDLLNTLPDIDQKNQLKQGILTLMRAQNSETIEAAASAFLSLYLQCNSRNFAEENIKLSALRQTSEALQSYFNTLFQDFSHRISGDKLAIHRLCSELTTCANDLDRWSQEQRNLPIWNLFSFDMQWVTETVKGLAFDRAQSKIKQLFEALYQRHNYVGFTNQVVFLPFLEKFGKHHLKT